MNYGIDLARHIDLTDCDQKDLWVPKSTQHKRWIDEDGISLFNLPPYSMTQLVIAGDKIDWFYVDTGHDGHAVRTFEKAKMVLMQSIKWHQEAVRLQLEIAKEKKS